MKKGISLIVLVITIIVMIIIAGAIIISLNQTNILTRADEAVDKSDVSIINDKLALAYVDLKFDNPTIKTFDATSTYVVEGTAQTVQAYYESKVAEIVADKTTNKSAVPEGHVVKIYANGSAMVVPHADTAEAIVTLTYANSTTAQ